MVRTNPFYKMLRSLDLCAGIGGIPYANRDYLDPQGYSEIDKYCVEVLKERIKKGDLKDAPIFGDLREINHEELPAIDIITAGFPCQDISVAGLGTGLEGDRSGLFFDIMSLSKKIKPKFIFLENVLGIRTRGLDRVVWELTDAGYDSRWCSVSASETKAPHQRRRWFLLAYRNSNRLREQTKTTKKEAPIWWSETSSLECYRWSPEPRVDRVAYGLPHRVDRIKCLGNSVVPSQTKLAFELLMGIKSLDLVEVSESTENLNSLEEL